MKPSKEFRKRLLNEAGVAVLADIHVGARVPSEGQHVRFSYAASKEAIEQGIARMAEFIRGGPIRLDSSRGLAKWILCG